MKAAIFLTFLTCLVLIARQLHRAPEGFEDEKGFHYGRREVRPRALQKPFEYTSRVKEQMLSPDELKNVTNENWTKIHTYSDGADLKRMKLYPPAGSQRTEEFYYDDGKLVFVFLEANGAGKENHDQNATGDKYYFTDGKLIAATAADGKSLDVKSAEAKRMSEKLQKESEAFRAAVK
jgi:hypothetical protein